MITSTERAATSTNIRGVDPELWRQLRIEAVRRGVPIGTLLNAIIQEWIDLEQEQEN